MAVVLKALAKAFFYLGYFASEYVLIQFIADMEYSIIPSSKVQKNSEGIRAPYGPHKLCVLPVYNTPYSR